MPLPPPAIQRHCDCGEGNCPLFTVSFHSLSLHATVQLLNPLSIKHKSGPEQNIIITHQPSIILCSNDKHWLLFLLLIYPMVSGWSLSEKIQTIFLLLPLSHTHTAPVTSKGSLHDPPLPVHEWPLSEWWASCSQPRVPQVAGSDPWHTLPCSGPSHFCVPAIS